ncbi:MAG: AAA family ATPase [Deltaproteobacteria bacterium]|nr:AAA family ATPase [Deltaproteobacteria bacterium]
MSLDIIPRPEVRNELFDALGGGSVLLYGPRRVGKSTLLNEIAEHPPHAHTLLRIDLEGHLQHPVEELASQVRHHLRIAGLGPGTDLKEHIEQVEGAGFGVRLRQAGSPGPWEQLRDDLEAAVSSQPGHTLVVALDEVPWWLDAIVGQDGAGAGRAALATLRRLRQHRLLSERLRFVLTGSVGLAGLASELGASAELNDLATVVMTPMTLEQGATLFEAELTAAGRQCSPVAARHAAQLAGGSPHWIKRLASAIPPGGALDAEVVEAACEALLAPAVRMEFADEGREHFRRRHGRVMPALLAMLEAVSGGDTGQPVQGAINAALQVQPELTPGQVRECVFLLVDGFYLRQGPEDTLEWVNPLFRRWWLRYGGP